MNNVNFLACGPTSYPASKEHVFSKWLLKELKYLDAPIALYRTLADGSSTQVRVPVRLDDFKLKRVCRPCNNGWMSELESVAKPLLLGLIKEGRALDSLNEDERQILAKWAGKTAIIESYAVGAESPVDPELLRWMRPRQDNTPGRFCVAACPQSRLAIGHLQIGVFWKAIGDELFAGNIIVIVLPKVAFTCMFPKLVMDYEPQSVPSLYKPLWPFPVSWRVMDQKPMPDTFVDDADFLHALAERVELKYLVQ
jgi:hypothetical protein